MTSSRPERTAAGLGRGLAALIPQRSTSVVAPVEIPLARIKGNPYQPRQRVEQEALERLAASIAEHGVLQPILVTETLEGYQLVAGERRVRASQLAGLERIPAVVRQMADRDQLALALVENIQRADLNAMEEAHAFRQLIDEFGLSQEQVADRVGRARATVAQHTAPARDGSARSRTRSRAARSRRAMHGPWVAWRRRGPGAARSGRSWRVSLSVRQTEELARPPARRRRRGRDATRGEARGTDRWTPTSSASRRTCGGRWGPRSALARTRKGGRIVIEYYGDDELTRLYDRLTGGTA